MCILISIDNMAIPAHLKPWMDHLAKFRKAHPNMKPIECAKEAKKTYHKKGGNPALIGAIASAVPEALNSITKGVETGVKTQHEFNKDNGALAAEILKNKTQLLRDLKHQRYWDPEKMPAKLRLKKFGINPPSTQNEPKNEAKLEKADEALEEYVDQQFEKYQNKIDARKAKGKSKKK
jgi:hypothetical protein